MVLWHNSAVPSRFLAVPNFFPRIFKIDPIFCPGPGSYPRIVPQGVSGHFRTHGVGVVIKSQTGTFQRIQPFKKRFIRRRERVRSVRTRGSDLNRPDIGVSRAQKLPLTFWHDL